MRYVPIADAPQAVLALGWREDARGPLVERFFETVRDLRAQEAELLPDPELMLDAIAEEIAALRGF
jgi:hypothetical protein